MTGRASYDPGPDLAALLRVLQWSRPPGCPYPGSAADLHARLLQGLGLAADAGAPECLAALRRVAQDTSRSGESSLKAPRRAASSRRGGYPEQEAPNRGPVTRDRPARRKEREMTMDARQGYWQERKRAWLALGIRSELGRPRNLLKFSDTVLDAQQPNRAGEAKQASYSVPRTQMLGNPPLRPSEPVGAGHAAARDPQFTAKHAPPRPWRPGRCRWRSSSATGMSRRPTAATSTAPSAAAQAGRASAVTAGPGR